MVNHILITCTLVLAVIISFPVYAGRTENGDYDLQSDTKKLSLQEQKTLLTAICGNKNIRKEEGNYICDRVPNYPEGCAGIDPFKITGVNFGNFTGNDRVEAIIDYNGCEAHVNEFGGSVLLRQESGKWRVISFTPGIRTNTCLNFQSSLLCFIYHTNMAGEFTGIVETVIKNNKLIQKSHLLDLSYPTTLIEECRFFGKPYSMRYLQDWKRQGNDVVLEVRYAADVNPPKTCKDTELKQFEQTVKKQTVSGTLIYHKTENGFILAPESQAFLIVLNRMNRIDDSEDDDTAETQKSASTSDSDFRDVQWGMSVNKVKEIEKTKLISEQKGYKDILIYSDSLMGLDCHVGYVFVNDKLVRSKYIITQKHTNKNEYIYDYDRLKKILIDKYGEPEWTKNNDDKTWLNSLFKGSPEDWGKAVSAGHLVYSSEWHTPKSKIGLSLSGDNFEIELVIEYKSWKFGELEEKADRENAKSRM